jgi:hypothetical protein
MRGKKIIITTIRSLGLVGNSCFPRCCKTKSSSIVHKALETNKIEEHHNNNTIQCLFLAMAFNHVLETNPLLAMSYKHEERKVMHLNYLNTCLHCEEFTVWSNYARMHTWPQMHY